MDCILHNLLFLRPTISTDNYRISINYLEILTTMQKNAGTAYGGVIRVIFLIILIFATYLHMRVLFAAQTYVEGFRVYLEIFTCQDTVFEKHYSRNNPPSRICYPLYFGHSIKAMYLGPEEIRQGNRSHLRLHFLFEISMRV